MALLLCYMATTKHCVHLQRQRSLIGLVTPEQRCSLISASDFPEADTSSQSTSAIGQSSTIMSDATQRTRWKTQ